MQGEACTKQEKLIADLNLQVEGAADALDSMRKDMTEMVDLEIAEKEQQFEEVAKMFEETKEVLKQTTKELEQMKKQAKLQALATKLDKKQISDLKREVVLAKGQADDQEAENRRMKRAEEARYLETEGLYRDNESYKQELAYIHQTYELDNLEDKLRGAQKTEQWAESILQELNQLFNCVE